MSNVTVAHIVNLEEGVGKPKRGPLCRRRRRSAVAAVWPTAVGRRLKSLSPGPHQCGSDGRALEVTSQMVTSSARWKWDQLLRGVGPAMEVYIVQGGARTSSEADESCTACDCSRNICRVAL
jgi:hypothetical protein